MSIALFALLLITAATTEPFDALSPGGLAASGPPGGLRNARVTVKPSTRGLAGEVEAARQPTWIGYAMSTSLRGRICCYRSWSNNERTPRNGMCLLECRDHGTSFEDRSQRAGATLAAEQEDQVVLLLRVEAGRVGRVAAYSFDCGLDAGGLPLLWLEGLSARDSLTFLGGLVGASVTDEDAVLTAIAAHRDSAADVWLERFVAPGQSRKVREQAAFWMGEARGRRGYETLRRLAKEDRDPKFREHLAFALSVSEVAEAQDAIVELARTDAEPQVRGQALFWLAQKAGQKAKAEITRAITEDPETEVKKKAVFALSEMPDGVTLLIQVARTNRNPAVREQAYFWLGQSEDRRALDFLTEVLKR